MSSETTVRPGRIGFMAGYFNLPQDYAETLMKECAEEEKSKVKPKDQISGGKSDGMNVQDIAEKHDVEPEKIQQQVEKGKKVEMEHTNDPTMAKEIARDHEEEFPNYYSALDDMEKKLKSQKKAAEESELSAAARAFDTAPPELQTQIIAMALARQESPEATIVENNPEALALWNKTQPFLSYVGFVNPELERARLAQTLSNLPPDTPEEIAELEKMHRGEFPSAWKKASEVPLSMLLKQAVAKSKAQQRFFGLVRAVQKGETKAPSKKVREAATGMSMKSVKDYASTKRKGLPERKEQKD